MKKVTIAGIIAFLFEWLFLYTAISKLQVLELTAEQMSVMPVVSSFPEVASWLLPVFEILLALLILFPKTRLLGLYGGTSLMLLFTGYVIYIMKTNSRLPCTCGGFLQELTWGQHVFFNSAFVLIGVYAIWIFKRTVNNTKRTIIFAS